VQSTLEAFRAGDPDAIRVIYRRYAGPVQTVVMSIVHDRELAADAVQQTFVKAWKAASAFDADRELAPWLYTIARRTAIDVLRAERRPTRGDHAPETDSPVAPLSFERTWEAFEVRRAVDDLPHEERDIMRLAHMMGMSQVEIAEHLSIPLGTVKSRAHRAQRRLAIALAHLLPEENQPAPSDVEGGGATP
jgi:RNA polymerase sigma-70 factor (ECF subfamily)